MARHIKTSKPNKYKRSRRSVKFILFICYLPILGLFCPSEMTAVVLQCGFVRLTSVIKILYYYKGIFHEN